MVARAQPQPDEVAPEIEAVLAEPMERFSVDEHPLRDVVTGTVIDDLSGLNGCWGWRTVETVEDPNTGQTADVETTTVLKFDLDAGLLTHYRLVMSPSLFLVDCEGDETCLRYFVPDAVGVYYSDWRALTDVDDNSLLADDIDGWGAAVDRDGHLAFDCRVALIVAMNAVSLDYFVTLQGDYLKTIELFDRADYTPDTEGDLWVRFDCPAASE